MTDLEFLHAHLPDFPEYGDEAARNGSDMRVRAFVGMALTDVLERLAPLDAAANEAVEKLIFRSQFSDNGYLKRLGHASLTDADLVALAREDRKLLEIATRLGGSDASGLGEILSALEAQYETRYLPLAR